MGNDVSGFGKEVGLIHEVLITGRKVGAGPAFWKRLARDPEKFRKILQFFYSFEIELTSDIKDGIFVDEMSRKLFDHELKVKEKADLLNKGIKSTISLIYCDVSGLDLNNLDSLPMLFNIFLQEKGYHPADIFELTCFAQQYPDIEMESRPVALDSAIINREAKGISDWKCQIPYFSEKGIATWNGNFWFSGFSWFAAVKL